MRTLVLSIDPGDVQSAFVLLQRVDRKWAILDKGILPNLTLLKRIKNRDFATVPEMMAIEMIASFGMPVGKTIFETVFWIGRFVQAWSPKKWDRIYRQEVKLHLCGQPRAKDANIRQALLDMLGPPGTKKSPGATHGVSKDIWSALAVGVTFFQTKEQT